MIRKIVIFSYKALKNVYNDNHRAGFKDFFVIFIENTLNMLNHNSLFEINMALYLYSMVNQKDGQVDHFHLEFRELLANLSDTVNVALYLLDFRCIRKVIWWTLFRLPVNYIIETLWLNIVHSGMCFLNAYLLTQLLFSCKL